MDEQQTIFNYELKEEIGRGGFGVVRRAVHKDSGRVVAVKLLPEGLAGDESFIERFRKEVQILGRLKHPNIVDFVNADVENGTPYLMMELCEGGSLEDRLKSNKVLTFKEAVDISKQVLSALAYAHKQSVVIDGRRKIVVHGDTHPGNILFDAQGNVKVGDFGLANLVEDSIRRGSYDYSGFSKMGRYAAPERRDGVILPQNDVYSFGLVLAEMFGRKPGNQRPLREINKNVPEDLANLIERNLYEYTLRHKDAHEMLKALEAFERAQKPGYNYRPFAFGGLALAVLFMGFWNIFYDSSPTPKPVARVPVAVEATATPIPPTPTQQPPAPTATTTYTLTPTRMPTSTTIPLPFIVRTYPERDDDCVYEVMQTIDGRYLKKIVECDAPILSPKSRSSFDIIFRKDTLIKDIQIVYHDFSSSGGKPTIEEIAGRTALKLPPDATVSNGNFRVNDEITSITTSFYDSLEGYIFAEMLGSIPRKQGIFDNTSFDIEVKDDWYYAIQSDGSFNLIKTPIIPRSKGWHEIGFQINPNNGNIFVLLDGYNLCNHFGFVGCKGLNIKGFSGFYFSNSELSKSPIWFSDIYVSRSHQLP